MGSAGDDAKPGLPGTEKMRGEARADGEAGDKNACTEAALNSP